MSTTTTITKTEAPSFTTHGSRRTVPLEVLSLGMPRTGTTSMQAALQILGYNPTMHAREIAADPDLAEPWVKLMQAKWQGKGRPITRDMMDAALGDYAAVTDAPSCMFWEELIDLYPEAKVVLVERDYTRWLTSFSSTIISIPLPRILTRILLDWLTGSQIQRMYRLLLTHYFRGHTNAAVLANAEAVYKDHYAGIRAKCPKDRLLEYKLGSGWQPLCDFLGKEVPREKFPQLNDAEDYHVTRNKSDGVRARKAAVNVVRQIGKLLLGAVVAWWVWRLITT